MKGNSFVPFMIHKGDGSTLNLDFTTMGALDSRFTFTRSTTATYIDSSGYVATMAAAATNDPTKARFDYDPTTLAAKGLLIEGQATNLLNFSETFATTGGTNNNWADTNLTRTSTNNTSPRNDATALRITASAANGTIISSTAISTSAARTLSVWLRRVTGTGNIQYTLDNGTTYTTQAITAVWVRYTFATTTAAQRVGFRIVTSADAIEIWGVQLEDDTGASSYIPTVASQVIKAADSCKIGTITPFNYSTTNGTLFYSGIITKQNTVSYPTRVGFYNTSDIKCFSFYTNANSLFFGAAGNATAEISKPYTLNTAFKAAMSLNASLSTSELIVNLNGSTGATGATALTATNTPNQFSFGQTGYEAYFPCGTISAVKYWNTTKTAAELAALTA